MSLLDSNKMNTFFTMLTICTFYFNFLSTVMRFALLSNAPLVGPIRNFAPEPHRLAPLMRFRMVPLSCILERKFSIVATLWNVKWFENNESLEMFISGPVKGTCRTKLSLYRYPFCKKPSANVLSHLSMHHFHTTTVHPLYPAHMAPPSSDQPAVCPSRTV